ncbi:MAG: tetratricopeptide repeat protein [Terracidiphilus sp.]
MRTLGMMVVVASMICAAPYGRTDPLGDTAKTDKMEAARMAEVKGDLARIHKDNQMAVAYYLEALRIRRQDAELSNKVGITELQLGERGRARKYFSLAIKYDPRLTAALNNLGAVALLDKKYKPAVVYFKQALAMDESNAATHVNLAEAWVGLSEIDRAMTEYARALELDADVLSSSQDGVIAQVRTPEQRARISFLIAKSYMKRGNLEGALDYLDRAKEQHYPDLAKVYSDPDFSALWKDPRLAKIVKR